MNFGEYTPNLMQQEILAAFARVEPVISVRAGWGSGKNTAMAMMCEAVAQARPCGRTLLVTDSAERLRHVLRPAFAAVLAPLGWFQRGDGWFDRRTGSSIIDVTLDSARSFEGVNASSGVAIIDNCHRISPGVADLVLQRIRSPEYKPCRALFGLPSADEWWLRLSPTPFQYEATVCKANLREPSAGDD